MHIECWLELHCIVEQHLLRVPDDTKCFELFKKIIAPKFCREDDCGVTDNYLWYLTPV